MSRSEAMREFLRRSVNRLTSQPHLPRRLMETPGDRLLLHVSDTPYEIYGFLRRLVRWLAPAVIVHTGDLVDDVKLEYDVHRTQLYTARVTELIAFLEASEASAIYITPGNHDNADILRSLVRRSYIVEAGAHRVANRHAWIDHYGGDHGARAELDFFGHARTPLTGPGRGGMCLNGLTHANVIDLPVNRVYPVEYPMDVDRYRRLDRSTGGM